MHFFKELPQNEKIAFIEILSTIGYLNNMDQKKISFIRDIYNSCELKTPPFEELIKNTPVEKSCDYAKEITSLKLKRVLIRELFFIAYSDGELIEDELDFIIKIAGIMGVSETIALTIGDWVVRSIELEGEGDALFSKDA